MDNPLRYVYFAEPCPVCGGTFPVTLLHVLKQQRLAEEWTGARPCENCHSHYLALRDRVPADRLRAFAEAWDSLKAELDARSLNPIVGDPARQHTH